MALQFVRNAKVYVELTTGSPNTVWEIPVLDGFSFSQSMNSTEITINEAGSTSRRARLLFNDSLAPVEWSFSTYARPFTSAGAGAGAADDSATVHAVEECMWAMFMGADTCTSGVFQNSSVGSPASTINVPSGSSSTFDFSASNVSSFTDNWNIYIVIQETGATAQVFKLEKAACNSVTMDFDIEGIATFQWSGFARAITDEGSVVPTRTIYEKITDTSTFIRNRLSTLSLVRTDVSPDVTYDIVLTGGSINFENNITYLTPEELGKVNQPFANITGTRSISGIVTCYLDTGNGKSNALWAALSADTTTVRNVFDMAVKVGGATGNRVEFDLPTAHVEIPTIGVEDLLTLDVAFHGQVASGNVDSTNEATIIYGV